MRMGKRTSCLATVTSTLGDPSMVSERWERGREGRSRCTWVNIKVIGERVLHPKGGVHENLWLENEKEEEGDFEGFLQHTSSTLACTLIDGKEGRVEGEARRSSWISRNLSLRNNLIFLLPQNFVILQTTVETDAKFCEEKAKSDQQLAINLEGWAVGEENWGEGGEGLREKTRPLKVWKDEKMKIW